MAMYTLQDYAEQLRKMEIAFKDAQNNLLIATRNMDSAKEKFYKHAKATSQGYRKVKTKDGTTYRADNMRVDI